MFHQNKFINYLVCLSLLFIVACSGGTGGTGARPGGGGSNVVVGTITQISTSQPATAYQQVAAATITGGNTVTINGVQFDVSSSAITLDGTSGTDADLRVGMVATITGSIDATGTTGVADSVSVREVIKGPVTAIDLTNNTITVLGQTIQTSTSTHWDEVTDITGIALNNVIEVSGYLKNNVIAATRIELLNSNEDVFKVTGNITNLDTSGSSFQLGTLVVDYSNADLSGVSNGALSNGLSVEVKGTFAGSTLVATAINSDQLEVSDAESIEIQGFITSTSGTPVTGFDVNNQQVQIDASTQFSNGTVTDILPGVFVNVQGTLLNGVLTASQVSFEDVLKITAVVSSVDASSFTLTGLGVLIINVDALTEFDESIPTMSDLMTGYTVTVHGNLVSPGIVTATQISLESTSASTDVSLQGPIDSIASDYSAVTIFGIGIDTTSIPDTEFVVDGADTNSRDYFFSVVTTGDVITAQGTLASSVVTWQSLSYENPGN